MQRQGLSVSGVNPSHPAGASVTPKRSARRRHTFTEMSSAAAQHQATADATIQTPDKRAANGTSATVMEEQAAARGHTPGSVTQADAPQAKRRASVEAQQPAAGQQNNVHEAADKDQSRGRAAGHGSAAEQLADDGDEDADLVEVITLSELWLTFEQLLRQVRHTVCAVSCTYASIQQRAD